MQYTLSIMHQRSWLQHSLSIFVSISFVTGLSLYLLLNESHLASFIPCTHECTNVIGDVTSVIGDVRRRLPGDILWTPLQKKVSIIDGDTLFTGADGSRVRIRLDKDITLDIDSDSMIHIRLENNIPVLNLESGSLKSLSDSGELIKVKISAKTVLMNLSGQPKEISSETLK